MTRPRIAFHAPLKPPDHDTPSGDRRMARAFMDALGGAGFDVSLATRLRTLDRTGDIATQVRIGEEARATVARLLGGYRAGTLPRPDLWFTYHVYYKAPDLVGPAVCDALAIPYVIAEASHAPKRLGGPWDAFARAAEGAIRRADAVFHMTAFDRVCLTPLVAPARLVHLRPWLDPLPPASHDRGRPGPVRLLAVAMMRPGDKLESYRRLAAALPLVAGDWTLTVAGDGTERGAVEALLAPLGARVSLRGLVRPEGMAALYADHDILVWPGVGEAYGMAYLEAQAAGLSVVAQAIRGVPDVVADGHTGSLTPDGDTPAYASAIARLVSDRSARDALGMAGPAHVRTHHSLQQAAATLGHTIRPLLGTGAAR